MYCQWVSESVYSKVRGCTGCRAIIALIHASLHITINSTARYTGDEERVAPLAWYKSILCTLCRVSRWTIYLHQDARTHQASSSIVMTTLLVQSTPLLIYLRTLSLLKTSQQSILLVVYRSQASVTVTEDFSYSCAVTAFNERGEGQRSQSTIVYIICNDLVSWLICDTLTLYMYTKSYIWHNLSK